jgi:hypothetical protein
MQAIDKTRFVEVMRYLSINFPERLVDQQLIESYFHDLSDFPIDAVETAAKEYVMRKYSFPYVADLIRLSTPVCQGRT